MIGLVGGRSHDPLLGMVKGGCSLAFRGHLECIEDLTALSSQFLERAGSGRYKATFGWVDRLTPVEDDDLRQALTEQLTDELLAYQHRPDVDAMLPDDLLEDDDDRSIAHVVFPGQRKASACEGDRVDGRQGRRLDQTSTGSGPADAGPPAVATVS